MTPEYIAKLEAFISKVGPRKAANALVDHWLTKLIGLTSSDLADTMTFANGLDAIEKLLANKKYEAAKAKGLIVAKKMVREEGGGDLLEMRKMVKDAINEIAGPKS